MKAFESPNRRRFLGTLVGGTAALWTPGLLAEELTRTARQTEGPFYPDRLPLDTDNDLIVINDATNPAVGEITYLSGRVLDAGGKPLRNTLVEIWQCDANGAYLHSRTGNRERRDTNFQGYGRFLTGSSGEYVFRTIKPVPYPGRTPHIHFKVSRGGRDVLTTQLYVRGEPQNARDGLFGAVRDPAARESIMTDFKPIPDSQVGELAASWDIVLGVTPAG
jgi:protocatechuate 3,4-dioxygenase beta subunit